MRDGRTAAGLVIVALAGSLAGGCNLLTGLSELTVGDGSTTGPTGGSGGSGGTTTGTAGTGGAGGATGGAGGATGGAGGAGGCADGELNGSETDVDCGGTQCDPCKTGAACLQRDDCESGICLGPAGAKMCRSATSLAAGNAHVCAALDDGTTYCWGANGSGQLGVESVTQPGKPVLVDIEKIVQVTAGGAPGETKGHTCAVDQSKGLFCWGENGSGQLGTGDKVSTHLPAPVPLAGDVDRAAAGAEFTCALQSDQVVFCWGNNENGQLGDGGTGAASVPDPIELGGITAKVLAAGARHACAVTSDDVLQCWGDNTRGQIGVEPLSPASKLLAGPELAGAALAAAGHDFTCARDAASLWCWGDNTDQQLTSAVPGTLVVSPTDAGVTGVVEITAGADATAEMGGGAPLGGHACAILGSGAVTCWGSNTSGQLGRGTISAGEGAPAEVPGLTGVKQIAAGTEMTCAILATGAVLCWGKNDQGQLGQGSAGGPSTSPQVVQWP